MASTMTPTNAVIANLAVNPAFAKSIKYEPTTNTTKPVRDPVNVSIKSPQRNIITETNNLINLVLLRHSHDNTISASPNWTPI